MIFHPECHCLCEQIAQLNKATRGKFEWTEESVNAYEQLMAVLTTNSLLYSYIPDYNLKFYMSVDTSLNHTSYILYQLCIKLHPRVIGYFLKTWPESFQTYSPATCVQRAVRIVNGTKDCKTRGGILERFVGVYRFTDFVAMQSRKQL